LKLISRCSFFTKAFPVGDYFFDSYREEMQEDSYEFSPEMLERFFNIANTRVMFNMYTFGAKIQ